MGSDFYSSIISISYHIEMAGVRDEAEIKVPKCVEFLFVVFVVTSGA